MKRKKSLIYKLEGAVYTLRNQQLALLVRNIVDMLLTKVVCVFGAVGASISRFCLVVLSSTWINFDFLNSALSDR